MLLLLLLSNHIPNDRRNCAILLISINNIIPDDMNAIHDTIPRSAEIQMRKKRGIVLTDQIDEMVPRRAHHQDDEDVLEVGFGLCGGGDERTGFTFSAFDVLFTLVCAKAYRFGKWVLFEYDIGVVDDGVGVRVVLWGWGVGDKGQRVRGAVWTR